LNHKRSLAVVSVLGLLALGGCASADNDSPEPVTTQGATTDPTDSPTDPPTSSATERPGTVVEITIEGDSITPNGKRVDAELDEPITFEVTSDRAGELHVHTSPDQELEYAVGTTRFTLTVDRPGIVEVEDHDTGTLVVQLEVS
jgi:hypothetical protein